MWGTRDSRSQRPSAAPVAGLVPDIVYLFATGWVFKGPRMRGCQDVAALEDHLELTAPPIRLDLWSRPQRHAMCECRRCSGWRREAPLAWRGIGRHPWYPGRVWEHQQRHRLVGIHGAPRDAASRCGRLRGCFAGGASRLTCVLAAHVLGASSWSPFWSTSVDPELALGSKKAGACYLFRLLQRRNPHKHNM